MNIEQEKMIVEALPSLYPLKDYEEDAIRVVLDAIPHWIPVEQALPELRHDVLLTVFFHERWNVAEGYRQDGEFMFWNNGRLDSVLDEENRVIAWMPKPEPARR